MDIVKDEKNLHKRVVIQIEPLDKSKIVKLQETISPKFEGFESYNYKDIHMTLFHFGKPQDLYKDIVSNSKQNINYNDFISTFIKLLEQLSYLIGSFEIELNAGKISLFDYPADTSKKFRIVLLFEESKRLKSIRQEFIDKINHWLLTCSIKEYKTFYKNSPNFRYNSLEDFSPHVTLGRVFGRDMPDKFDAETEQISVPFGNLNFLNVIN